MNHWTENQTKLDQTLALERMLARRQRQQWRQHQWQQVVHQAKRLQATVTHLWWRLGRQRPVSFHS